MATYQLRAMSLGEILDGALVIYRSHFGTLVSIAIVCQGVPTIMSTYVTVGGGPLFHPVLWLLAVGLSAIGGLITAGASIWVISEAYLGREVAMGEAIGFAVGKMVPIFLAGLAKYLLVFLAVLLFIIPGIVVACGYAVVTQVVVLEALPAATDALGRSWRLTRGYKGKAFALGFIVFALIYLPFFAATAIAAFIPSLTMTVEIGAELVWLMIYPIIACAFTLLYYDLRVRKEAFDLEHLSQQLGIAVESAGA